MKTLVTRGMGFTQAQREQLEADGFSLVFHPDETVPPPEPGDFQVAICNALFANVDPREFPNLEFVQLTSAGLDRVPLEYFAAEGIPVANAGSTFVQPMTQWALLQILNLYREAGTFAKRQQRREWNKKADQLDLEGKTATIIGYGAVGQSIAAVLRHFGVRIIAVSRSPKTMETPDLYLPLDRLERAVAKSDIVVVTVAAAPETESLLDSSILAELRPGSVLLNLSRGSVIDQDALVQRIRKGDLRGAALDVFEVEPLPEDSPLWDLPGVVITPHVSFYSDRIQNRLFEVVRTNLLSFKKEKEETGG